MSEILAKFVLLQTERSENTENTVAAAVIVFTCCFGGLCRYDEVVRHMMMASCGGEDHTAMEDEEQGSSSEEETLKTRATDVLDRLSEEAFLAELEPYELPSSGWEEAVSK